MENIKILSIGGSIVAPQEPDCDFIRILKETIEEYLKEDKNRKLILIIGGGGPARLYQESYRKISSDLDTAQQDWIGIAATRLNAQLIRGVFQEYCSEEVVTNPTVINSFEGRILVAAGWKPGFSTDNDAVLLAEKFNADTVINLSNIAKVYSDDPKINPDAVPLDELSWTEFRKLVGDEWTPGKNAPFDPVATKKASALNLKVITAAGRDIVNLKKILNEESFEGTIIGPQ